MIGSEYPVSVADTFPFVVLHDHGLYAIIAVGLVVSLIEIVFNIPVNPLLVAEIVILFHSPVRLNIIPVCPFINVTGLGYVPAGHVYIIVLDPVNDVVIFLN